MHLGAEKGVGRIGGKTLLYYTISGALAVTIGLIVVNIIGPGRVDTETAQALLGDAKITASEVGIIDRVEGRNAGDIVEIFQRMFPSTL